MTKPRASLFSVPSKPDAPSRPESVSVAPAATRRHAVAKTREGKRNVTAYLDAEAFRQLKRLAADEDAKIQDLLVEGVNAVFEKRGLSRIA